MIYDVIIIGGGIAGTTAGIYATMAGFDTAIIEKELIGGKLNYIDRVNNLPGYLSIKGKKLAENMLKQLENIHTEIIYEETTNIEYTNKLYQIYTTGKVYVSRYLIIAIGSTPKKINGLKASYCEICEGHLYKGKNVAVIGGGDSAFSCALYLSNICKSVTILIRKDKARASSYLIDQVNKKNNIKIKYESNAIEDSKKYGGTFVKIGNEIDLKRFENIIGTPGAFLAGDCCSNHINQLIKAANDGMTAALKIIEIEKLN